MPSPSDHRSTRRGLLAGVAAGASSLAAGLATPGGPNAARDQATGATPKAGTPTRPGDEAIDGGTLVVGSLAEPDTLHPWLARTPVAFDLLDGVMDGLLRVNADGRLQPALAERVAVSDDNLRYTFVLRRGVRYHSGEALSGRDVVAAWETIADPAFGAALPGWDRIADVTLPDERTVEIATEAPYAPLLATVATTPLCPSAAQRGGLAAFREAFGRAPAGTGPFRVARWRAGERIELRRFPDHWAGPARLDGIDVRIVPAVAELVRELRSGGIGLVGGAGGIPAAEIDAAAGIPGVTTRRHVTRTWHHLDLKQLGFLRERAVRQALDFAVPRERIFREILRERGVPAFADQSPASWVYHPDLAPRPFEPNRAKGLLDGAGLRPGRDGARERSGEPFVLEVWGVEGDATARRIVEAIAEAWRAIGAGAIPRFAAPADLWGPLGYQFSDRMTACLYAWTNGNDPDDLYYWHSSQIPKAPSGSGGNLPAFFHRYAFQAEIDALIEAAAAEFDLERRRDLYRQIQELLHEEVPAIFLYWEEAFPIAADRLREFRPSAHTGLLWNAGEWSLTET